MGNAALVAQAPKQPTAQEILDLNVAHLPNRGWCQICVQARGRQNNHPKQHSKLPVMQLDFGCIKGFDDNNAHPTFTAIDIQPGTLVAIQALQLRSHTATALPRGVRKNITHHLPVWAFSVPVVSSIVLLKGVVLVQLAALSLSRACGSRKFTCGVTLCGALVGCVFAVSRCCIVSGNVARFLILKAVSPFHICCCALFGTSLF